MQKLQCYFSYLYDIQGNNIGNKFATKLLHLPRLDKYPLGVYNTGRGYIPDTPQIQKGAYPLWNIQKNRDVPVVTRPKERSQEEYTKLIHRLNRIEGQIRGIRGMVEKNAYCPDILVQVAAANAALNAFNKELLANHIRTCVADDIRAGKDEVIDELVITLQKLMK